MKLCDKFKLITYECKYEKSEWILSVILQYLIFTSVLFLFTIACDIDKICGEYIKPMYLEGYDFVLKGFNEQDIEKLHEMGFREISFSDEDSLGYAVLDDLDGIWIYKLQAAFSNKDIWNEDLDEMLSMIFFCQIIFGSLGIVLLIIMMNNLSNSFGMKLIRRKKYICMLRQLGCSVSVCRRIFFCFFLIRNILSLSVAIITNSYLISALNKYMGKNMYISSSFKQYDIYMICFVTVISIFIVLISFTKQWRQCSEN